MSNAHLEALNDLLGTRDKRRAKLAGERPNDHQPQEKAAFDQSLAKDQDAIQEKQQAVLDWAKQAKPEEIADFRERVHAQVQERAQDSPEDKHAQVVFSTVDEWRQKRQQKNGGQSSGEDIPMLTATQRQQTMGPGKLGYAHYAASAKKEAEFMRDYEAKFDWSKHEAHVQKNIYRQ